MWGFDFPLEGKKAYSSETEATKKKGHIKDFLQILWPDL